MEDPSFALRLFDIGAVKFGEFTLKSGRVAPVYVDLRVLVSHPEALRQAGEMLASQLRSLTFPHRLTICLVPAKWSNACPHSSASTTPPPPPYARSSSTALGTNPTTR